MLWKKTSRNDSIGKQNLCGLGDDSTGDLNDWWEYNISTNSWSQISNLPGPARHHPFMFNAGGQVFAGLGHSGSVIYDDWYKLDTTSNTWTATNLFPGEARVAGTQFDWGGFGYVLSGDGDNHSYMPTGEMWQYDPTLDSWTQLTPHPGESRWAPGSFVINNDVYFLGGYNRLTGIYPNDMWKFTLGTTTGIKTNLTSNIKIYPNPADYFVSWDSSENIVKVEIYNSIGQLILSQQTKKNQINIKNLKEGVYFIRLYENGLDSFKTEKIIVRH